MLRSVWWCRLAGTQQPSRHLCRQAQPQARSQLTNQAAAIRQHWVPKRFPVPNLCCCICVMFFKRENPRGTALSAVRCVVSHVCYLRGHQLLQLRDVLECHSRKCSADPFVPATLWCASRATSASNRTSGLAGSS